MTSSQDFTAVARASDSYLKLSTELSTELSNELSTASTKGVHRQFIAVQHTSWFSAQNQRLG
ncbi:MAG: hypothetical protein L7W43_03520 [Rubripirellula sp.]|nr:hypothetical protein [Rubripirellula sp.]